MIKKWGSCIVSVLAGILAVAMSACSVFSADVDEENIIRFLYDTDYLPLV